MFKSIITSILLAVTCLSASAKIVAEAVGDTGARVALHDTKKMCVGAANYALFTWKDEKVEGCWVTDGNFVQIAFLDGTMLQLPVSRFTEPKAS